MIWGRAQRSEDSPKCHSSGTFHFWLEAGCIIEWNFAKEGGLVAEQGGGSPASWPPISSSLGLQEHTTLPIFYVGSGDPNLGTPVCYASVLWAEPPPRPD